MTGYRELLTKRRSIRDYEDRQVPLETIQEMLKETCLAPSAGNGQPWRFIIVQDKDLIKRISDECKSNLVSDLDRNPDAPQKKYEEALRNPGFNIFYNAPCIVFIVGEKDTRSLYIDCSLAAGYFMFSAVERGLGTCWIGLGTNIRTPELLTKLGIPDDHQIVAPVIVGYPREIPAASDRMEPKILKTIK